MEIVVNQPGALAATFAARLEERVRRFPRFAFAVPGGSAAEVFGPSLIGAAIDWRRVHLFWVDERAVPPGHADSNYGLAYRCFVRHLPIDAAHVHRMRGEAENLAGAAADYEAELRQTLGDQPRVDLALLGVGPDGHICSLFPRHPALGEKTRLVIAIDDAPKPPPQRLTVTLPALEDAAIVIAAFGDSKAAAIEEAIHNPASELPLALAIRQAREVLFLLDEGAASRLRTTD
jgi:6-phosphogluconolactonase